MGAKQRFLTERGSLRKVGERLYEDEAIHVDPFSPGFHWFHRREERQLPGLRDEALSKLHHAGRIDPEWKALDEARAQGLKGVQFAEPTGTADAAKGRGQMEQRAREALASGNLEELQKLAAGLEQGTAGPSGPAVATEEVEPDPMAFQFPPQTLEKARALGLEPEHFDHVRGKFRSLFRHLWHPVFFEAEGNLAGARVTAMLPKDTPDAQRDPAADPLRHRGPAAAPRLVTGAVRRPRRRRNRSQRSSDRRPDRG